ncbi:MAG TPA: hypothetical protein ACFYD3_10880 [Candidatus Hypogeohydataceae bacterium YC41]
MEWNISKGTSRCMTCERVFVEEETFYSTLCLEPASFLRKDFCLECWKGQNPEGFFSFWRTRMPKKEEPRRKVVDNATILNLFLRLQELTESWAKNMRYVLGLFLLRKKVLKLKGHGKDEQGIFMELYNPGEDKTYRTYNTNLTEEEIEKINNDVLKLLDPAAGQDASLALEQST